MVNNYIRVAGISIHALMKRATDYRKMTKKEDWISIHALMKRATMLSESQDLI